MWVSGQGHVVCYNEVTNFWDGINVMSGHSFPGSLEGVRTQRVCAIDFHNNDVRNVMDDFMETDHASHNIRVWENRCFNSGVSGLSAQPVYGGPVYFIRNIVYNAAYWIESKKEFLPGNYFKLHCGPAGVLLYHNVTSGSISRDWYWSNTHFRNNIFMGPMDAGTHTDYSTLDYNAYRPAEGKPLFAWRRLTHPELLAEYETTNDRMGAIKIRRRIEPKMAEGVRCDTIEEVREKLGYEKHGMTVDYDIFRNVQKPVPGTEYDPADFDFRPREDAPVVDAGQPLANINDGFTGEAPDIGACEAGRPVPHYGPR